MLILLVSSFFVLFITSWFVLYYHYERYLKSFKGPTPLPLIGNVHQVGSTLNTLNVFYEFSKKYGNFKLFLLFKSPRLFIVDLKMVEYVLNSTELLGKAGTYGMLNDWLGTGLLTSTGDKWKKHRKMLTPSFHFKILEEYVDIFNKYSNMLVTQLEKEVNKDSVDISPIISLCSLDIICASSMGTNVSAQVSSKSGYVQAVKQISEIISERSISLLKFWNLFYRLSSDYYKQNQLLKILHSFTNSIIASRKKEIESDQSFHNNVEDDCGIKKRLSFLDAMLQYNRSSNFITDEEIRQEVDTFMFRGHDTTSIGISFTLFCLANHLSIQDKVVQELKDIFQYDKDRDATYKDLQNMKYLEMVIKETLRLYPPVPHFGRRIAHDVKYENVVLPKGIDIFIFTYGIHRDPNLYPNPDKFDPERFSVENQSSRPNYAYVPFSAGHRNCIGQKFAMLEMKAVVSSVLRKFQLLPSYPKHIPKPIGRLVLKSHNGLHISLKNYQS